MNKILLVAVAVLAVSACGQPRGVSERELAQRLWVERQQQLLAHDSWNLQARAAIARKGEAYQVGIRWQRDARRSMLLLQAPFGQGVFRIDSGPGADYRLRLPDGQLFVNRTPEALLEDALGWSLPISGLDYWIRGIPRPDGEFRHRLDRGGRARSIRQDRWNIEYLDYFDAALPPDLPRRIKLARDELTLKLVIEHWQPSAVEATPPDLFPEFD